MRYVIDLERKTCDCGFWAVSGLPCAHALVCILKKRMKSADFVHTSMTTAMYVKTYSHYMKPIPNESRWPTVDFAPILPPIVTRRAGRLKKLRRRGPSEQPPRVSRSVGTDATTVIKLDIINALVQHLKKNLQGQQKKGIRCVSKIRKQELSNMIFTLL